MKWKRSKKKRNLLQINLIGRGTTNKMEELHEIRNKMVVLKIKLLITKIINLLMTIMMMKIVIIIIIIIMITKVIMMAMMTMMMIKTMEVVGLNKTKQMAVKKMTQVMIVMLRLSSAMNWLTTAI